MSVDLEYSNASNQYAHLLRVLVERYRHTDRSPQWSVRLLERELERVA